MSEYLTLGAVLLLSVAGHNMTVVYATLIIFAKSLNPKIKVIAIGGSVKNISSGENFDAVFSILREPMTIEEAMKKSIAEKNISATVKEIVKLIL